MPPRRTHALQRAEVAFWGHHYACPRKWWVVISPGVSKRVSKGGCDVVFDVVFDVVSEVVSEVVF